MLNEARKMETKDILEGYEFTDDDNDELFGEKPLDILLSYIVEKKMELIDKDKYWICGTASAHWPRIVYRKICQLYTAQAIYAMAVRAGMETGRLSKNEYLSWLRKSQILNDEGCRLLLKSAVSLIYPLPGIHLRISFFFDEKPDEDSVHEK